MRQSSLTDWELWACAQQVLKQHGDRAPAFADGRVAELQAEGDTDGVATWTAIADRIAQLGGYAGARQMSRH